jgi:hypothetical protein
MHTRKETEMRDFEVPSEEEIRLVIVDAARSAMSKYPALAMRLHDEGDLIGEFYVSKRQCLQFQTPAHVAYLRHHVFCLMNCIAVNMMTLRRHEPLTWDGGVSLDAVDGCGRMNHDTFGGEGCQTPCEAAADEADVAEILASISGEERVTKGGVRYSPRMVAAMLAEGYKSVEIAEYLGIRTARVSAILSSIRESISTK